MATLMVTGCIQGTCWTPFVDRANASVLGVKYAQDVRKQLCKSVASFGVITHPTPKSKRDTQHRVIYGDDADAAMKRGEKRGGRIGSKRKKLNPESGVNFRKVGNWLYVSTWSAAVVDDGGGNLTRWADDMTGRVALLPPIPCKDASHNISVTDVLQTTYGEISQDVDLDRAVDQGLVTIQGRLTKVLMSCDGSISPLSIRQVRNWYYNATITLSCDKTLDIPSLTSIDVKYRGAAQTVEEYTGLIQKWVRRVLRKLGDDGKRAESSSRTLFESVWSSVLKWFSLALERIRVAVSRARPKNQDVIRTAQGFTGRDNDTFLQVNGKLDTCPKKRASANAASGMAAPSLKKAKPN